MNSFVPSAPLPEDFTPGDQDVVIGKGKKYYFHAGNAWLRNVVADRIEGYSQAVTKADKSGIISKVVDYVNENGRFVKLDPETSRWVYAEPLLCREKCSQTFRDNLAQTYRSSNVAKRNKRRQQQEDKCSYPSMGMGFFTSSFIRSDDSSFEMPSAKRMRFDMAEPTLMTSMQQQEVEEPAAWFDWEMPIRELEAGQQDACSSEELFEDIFTMLDFSAKESAMPTMKDFSSSGMGMEQRHFQQHTAAAFAA